MKHKQQGTSNGEEPLAYLMNIRKTNNQSHCNKQRTQKIAEATEMDSLDDLLKGLEWRKSETIKSVKLWVPNVQAKSKLKAHQ